MSDALGQLGDLHGALMHEDRLVPLDVRFHRLDAAIRALLSDKERLADYCQHHRDDDGTTDRKHCAWWGGEPCTCGLSALLDGVPLCSGRADGGENA